MPGPACYDHDYDDDLVRVARGPGDVDPDAIQQDDDESAGDDDE